MNRLYAACNRVWVCLFLSLSPYQLTAQQFLPLQPHKLQLARKLCREGMASKNPKQVAEGYYEYGKLYAAATDYLASYRWFMKALRILEPLGDTYELARLHVRLTDLALLQADYPQAWQHAHTALAVARRCRSDRGTIRACAVLARIHGRNWAVEGPATTNWPTSNSDSALYYFRQVETLAYRLNDPMEVAHVKQDIGGQLVGRNNPRAIAYLTTALSIATRHKSADKLHMTLGVASAYVHFGQPKRAWAYIQQAQRMARTEYPNVYYWQFAIEKTLIDFYQTTGNWQQVALHADQVHQWEKRDLIADREGAISRLGVEYETQKKEILLKKQRDELTLRAANEQIQQRFLWSAASLLVVTLSLSVVFFRLYRKNQRMSQRNADLVKEQNHRVKNNLQVVSSLLSLQANRLPDGTAQQAVGESQLRVQAMAALHQRLYDGDQLVRVNLPDYIGDVVEYVLNAFGYGHIQPLYDIQPISLSADDAMPLGIILNELTTNACKYAFPESLNPVYRVTCHQQNKAITLEVSDNGPGYVPDIQTNATQSQSFGIRLIQMQAGQLRGSYKFTPADGTLFTLHFTVS